MLKLTFMMAVCGLAAALPTPDIVVVPQPVRSDFIGYGTGDTFLDSALHSKMEEGAPAQSDAQVLGVLVGEGTIGSKGEASLDLPGGKGLGSGDVIIVTPRCGGETCWLALYLYSFEPSPLSFEKEFSGASKGLSGGFQGSLKAVSLEDRGSSGVSDLRGRHRGTGGIVGGSTGVTGQRKDALLIVPVSA
nr:uncharacterized protein LOC128691625 isoform X1 [Cherax quadricarinatus]